MPEFLCKVYGKITRTQQALVSHRCIPQKKKKEAQSFECKSNEAQIAHEMVCGKNDKRIFVCKFCGKVYLGWPDLVAHLTSEHGQGKVICKYCHSGVHNKTELQEHRETCTFYAESVWTSTAVNNDKMSTRAVH